MATVSPVAGTIPKQKRLQEREPFGDLRSMFEQALDEQAASRLQNAAAGFRAVLSEWMLQQWILRSKKKNTPIRDPLALHKKLRSSGTIDGWTARLIQDALCTPNRNCSWLHVDMLAGVVSAICFGHPTTNVKGGA